MLLFLLFLCYEGIAQCPVTINRPLRDQTLPTQVLSLATGWHLYPAMTDEFNNGTSLDLTKWRIWNYPCIGPGNYSSFKNDPRTVVVSNGKLKLWCIKDTTYGCPGQGTLYYSSAQIQTNPTSQYGFIEISCKLPNEKLLAPCFWTQATVWPGQTWTRYDEIDVFECLAENPNVYNLRHNIYHDSYLPTYSALTMDTHFDQPFAGNSFTFAVEWLPYEVNYYMNGKVVDCAKYTTDFGMISPFNLNYPGRSEYTCTRLDTMIAQTIYLSMSLYGAHPRNISEPFEIDYVRSYKLWEGSSTTYWPAFIDANDPTLSMVHQNVKIGGDPQHLGYIPLGRTINVWAHNSITFDKGTEIYAGSDLTARTVRTAPTLFLPIPPITNPNSN